MTMASTKVSATVRQAEAAIAASLPPIRNGSIKLAGYETPGGRHLAIDRAVQGIQIWTEDLPDQPPLGSVIRYPASRSRHSNLTSQAPRLATGKNALLWKLQPEDLDALLHWYKAA